LMRIVGWPAYPCVGIFPLICDRSNRPLDRHDFAAFAARDKHLDVPRPGVHCRAFFICEAMSLINADNSGEAAGNMIEASLNNGQGNTKLSRTARKAASYIVSDPRRHVADESVEPLFGTAEPGNRRPTVRREHKTGFAFSRIAIAGTDKATLCARPFLLRSFGSVQIFAARSTCQDNISVDFPLNYLVLASLSRYF
jgi:hypothetical protein